MKLKYNEQYKEVNNIVYKPAVVLFIYFILYIHIVFRPFTELKNEESQLLLTFGSHF